MGLFGGGGLSSSEDETQSADNIPPREIIFDTTASSPTVPSSSEPVAEKLTPSKEPPKDWDTIPLNITVRFTSIPPMTLEEKREARNRYVKKSASS